MVEAVITELSRFRALLVIARNSILTYKGKAVDMRLGEVAGPATSNPGSSRSSRRSSPRAPMPSRP